MTKWKLAGLVSVLAALVIDMRPAPADACGVRLMAKTSKARKAIARSSNPSRMLLVGSPPKRLEHDLAAAGHEVEVASSTSTAKRQSYAVVVVESRAQVDDARSKFSDAIVMVRSDDVLSDIRTVENHVARRRTGATSDRTVVAARSDRKPTDATPSLDRKVVAVSQREPVEAAMGPAPVRPPTPDVTPAKMTPEVKQPRPTPAPPPPPDKNEKIATTQKPTSEQPTPVHSASSSMDLHDEVFFTLGSAKVGNKARLEKVAKWLTENAEVRVTVEGYSDPLGNADANMTLSQARAESVRDYLVTAGVESSRIDVQAYGDTRLNYGRTDPRNRRVAIEAKR